MNNVPAHIAIIMDGNGRWSKSKFLPKKQGHKKGADALLEVSKHCNKIGVKYLTVYAFSTENWKRDEKEVNYLMELLNSSLDRFINRDEESNIKISTIGNIYELSEVLQEKIKRVEKETENNQGLNIIIAINYGGRDEIIRGIKKLYKDYEDRGLNIDDIDEKIFSQYIDTKGIPDPDLLIRTSNELRISNFLLWQIAYSEMLFVDKYWPDFLPEDIESAILEYNNRNRRYGGR